MFPPKDRTVAEAPRFVRGCRRRGDRFDPMRLGASAFIEFDTPDGSQWRLDVLSLGSGGVSFGLDEGRPPLQSGSRIERAVIQVGDIRVAGKLVVAHVTEEFSVGTVCGAEFHPATAADEQAMDELLITLAGPAEE